MPPRTLEWARDASVPVRQRQQVLLQRARVCQTASLLFALLAEAKLAQRLFSFLHVVECKSAGLDQMGHYRLRTSAEESQQFVDQPAARRALGDSRLEDVRVADLLHPFDGLLGLQAIDRCLNRRVSRAVAFGKGFLDFTDRDSAVLPERLHDLQFEFCQAWQWHKQSTMFVCNPTIEVCTGA